MAGHKAIISVFPTVFPHQWWQIEDLNAEGDKIVARTTMTRMCGFSPVAAYLAA